MHHSTTNFVYLQEGELDAIRSLKLSTELEDSIGRAASYAVLGAFAKRLGRMSEASEQLARSFEIGKDAGDAEVLVEVLQLLGEIAPEPEAGMEMLGRALVLRRERGDLRGEVKTLTDLSRLAAAVGWHDLSWQHHVDAIEAIGRYVEELKESPYAEDIRASSLSVIKTPFTTRAELPLLTSYLKIRHLLLFLDPAWVEVTL